MRTLPANGGYCEKTQWVSATDANGQIETLDILNLGGNAEQEGNLPNVAFLRNNVEWLDAGQICYAFDSYLRIPNKGQRHFLLESANSPVWGIYG
ncbi:hypothetical protein [Rhodoferax saidenbachensis]|uniref:Uncharacterized protein n=1 Tax=Rhodoferax saidenbachensis TaxID=1484693 RepID=A0ABU1ZTT2_9BURK|nr:hypothetical protein [Rhodoferax saidenbachensis]MDR7308260.1 hypothetical protein [Rhodoferax saidenbachensis]